MRVGGRQRRIAVTTFRIRCGNACRRFCREVLARRDDRPGITASFWARCSGSCALGSSGRSCHQTTGTRRMPIAGFGADDTPCSERQNSRVYVWSINVRSLFTGASTSSGFSAASSAAMSFSQTFSRRTLVESKSRRISLSLVSPRMRLAALWKYR